jgi:hypothetical protein
LGVGPGIGVGFLILGVGSIRRSKLKSEKFSQFIQLPLQYHNHNHNINMKISLIATLALLPFAYGRLQDPKGNKVQAEVEETAQTDRVNHRELQPDKKMKPKKMKNAMDKMKAKKMNMM